VDAGKTFDYERLRHAVRDIREASDDPSLTVKVFVDASLRWKLSAADKKKLEDDINSGLVEQAPAGLPADPFILRWAESHGGLVVTNDLYRDWVQDFPWVAQAGSGRFVSGNYDRQLKKWTFFERHSNGTPRNLAVLMGISVSPRVENIFTDPTAEKYRQPISRSLPSAVVFLLDQSGSMNGEWSSGLRKSHAVASFVNDTLYELILTCTRQDGVRPYVDVAVIGYGGDGTSSVRSELATTSLERPFLTVTDLVPLARMPDSSSTGQPVWVEPRASGSTPMNHAIFSAEAAIRAWVAAHPQSFPPIVFNITDGASTDGDPSDSAAKLTSHATSDGNTLLFTAHISPTKAGSLYYPESLDSGADEVARKMFGISSHIPQSMRLMARELGISMAPASRGFLFNASANDVIGMLNVGSPATRVVDPQG
jgi:uncharacterized protein YegL